MGLAGMIERGSDFSFVGLTGFMMGLRFMVWSSKATCFSTMSSMVEWINPKELAWFNPNKVARGR